MQIFEHLVIDISIVALLALLFAIVVAIRGLVLQRDKLYKSEREKFLAQEQRVEDALKKGRTNG